MDRPNSEQPEHPQKVGHFALIEKIGQGGMGTVYRARDDRLGREVALKLLPRSVSDDPDRRARFEREARAAASLKHEAIATIYEFGEQPDEAGTTQLFLAMELVEGRDLASILRRQQLSIQAVVNIATDLVQGLREAHRQGIVHRDLKPGNIRISNEGKVKILDFGLAKLIGSASSASESATDMATRTGSVMGTIPYMAPEQIRGQEVDGRTDLFALGVILYRMIGGHAPFSSKNIAEFILDLERGAPRAIEEIRPETPPALSYLLSRLLQKNPDDRPHNATEVLESLSSLTSEPATLISERIPPSELPKKQPTSLSLRTFLLPAAVLLALVLVALVARFSDFRTANDPEQRLAVVPFRNLTGDPESQYLAEGLASLLRSRLSALPDLRVMGQEATVSLSEIGLGEKADYVQRLGLTGVLEGSLQRGTEGLLVVVSFVDAATQNTLWSSEFPASAARMPKVPIEITQMVATRLFGTNPSLAEPEALPTGASFENYLRARQTLQQGLDSNSIRTAIALLRQIVDENPEFGLGHLELSKGLLLLHVAKPERRLLEEAERLIQVAERLEPDLPEVKVVRAQVLTYQGETGQAIELLEQTLEDRPEAEDVLAQLENSFAAAGSPDLAQATLDRLRELGDPEVVTRKLARLYERSGDFERAEALFLEAASSSPVSVQSLREIASFLLRRSRFEDARSFIERSLEQFPNHAETLIDLGTLRLFTGDIEGAIEAFDRLESSITDPFLASNKGTAHYMLGDIAEAEKLYRLASLLEPNDPTLRGNLGDALVQQGRTSPARDEYQEALRLVRSQLVYFPDDPALRSNEVLFLAKSGQCDDAAMRIETTEPLVARDPSGLHRLARSAGICLDREASLRLLARTIAAGIPFETVRQLDAEFRFLADDPEFEALAQ